MKDLSARVEHGWDDPLRSDCSGMWAAPEMPCSVAVAKGRAYLYACAWSFNRLAPFRMASPSTDLAVSVTDIVDAHERIKSHVVCTPVLSCDALDDLAGVKLAFKAEVLQRSGAFKIRGALNALACMTDTERKHGVVAHSSGNHGAAVAFAARLHGVEARVVMPRGAPQCKREAVTKAGATLIECEPTLAARQGTCDAIVKETGAVFIPPYNHPWVIAGQGTIALEVLSQVQDAGAIVVPVSGGGMLSGIVVAAKALNPGVRVIAAEVSGTNDAADVAKSFRAGQFVPCDKPDTIADGLQAQLGSLTWPIVQRLVDDVVVVSEEEILEAMRLIVRHLKVVVEPSGAVGLAAVLGQDGRRALQGVQGMCVVVLCGGNVDLADLGKVLQGLHPRQ